jgi:hypothetical protein
LNEIEENPRLSALRAVSKTFDYNRHSALHAGASTCIVLDGTAKWFGREEVLPGIAIAN